MPKRKKVLICGATGFIGRNIAETLAKDDRYEVTGVHFSSPPFAHPAIRFVRADLTNREQVDALLNGVDIVIQAAATTSGAKDIVTRPHIHIADNAMMNSLILRAAFENKVGHLVFYSCSVMYPSSETPLKETDFTNGGDIHVRYFGAGWTKVYVEKMCEFYSRIGGTKFTIIRHSNIYGPHDKYDLERSHVFGATVTKVMTAADGRVVVWGSGEEARDLMYVSDLNHFVAAALDRQTAPFALYNAGAGRAVSVKDLVAKIVAASGRTLRIEHDLSQPTIKTTLSLDASKAKRELDWEPRVSLDEGIRLTLDWYRRTVSKTDSP